MALLTSIQAAAAERLAEDPFFAGSASTTPRPVLVLTEQRGDLQARVRQNLGTLGIVCLVLTPTAVTTSRNRQRPYFDAVQLVVRAQENLLLNRAPAGTGQPASLVAEAVAWCLHGWAPEGLGGTLQLEEIRLVPDPRLLIYEAVFTLSAGMKEAPARVVSAA